MIKRITTSEDLYNLCESFRDFCKTNTINHFGDEKFCVDTIYIAWKHENLLINNCVIYGSENNGFYDSVCWFVINHDFRINKIIAYNYLWISQSHQNGYKCFSRCLKLLKNKNIDYINVGVLDNSPYQDHIMRILFKNKFKPESRSAYLKV